MVQKIEFTGPKGQTYTMRLFAPGSDVEAHSSAATENTNDDGTYSVSDVLEDGTIVGVYRVNVVDASDNLHIKGWVRMTNTAAASWTHYADNSGDKKLVDYAAFMFVMRGLTDSTPQTGKTVTCEYSLDGAAFATCTNADAELSNGVYTIDLRDDLAGDHVMFRFSATGCFDTLVEIQP